jgi:3D (Asp-Asp-Asp) domain-containing protein
VTTSSSRRAAARRQRRRQQRIRIAIELAVGAAALWFVMHPSSAGPPARAPVPADRDALDAGDSALAGDSGDMAAPFGQATSVMRPRLLRVPAGRMFRGIEERARAGERVAVTVTAYCLRGRTKRGNVVRAGIVAVDRALFPLGRDVELFFGRRSFGRFLADDTGGAITGSRIDVWMADCIAARRFGRRHGYAQLLPETP